MGKRGEEGAMGIYIYNNNNNSNNNNIERENVKQHFSVGTDL